MAKRRRTSRRWYSSDSADGISINRINENGMVSKKQMRISVFDSEHVAVSFDNDRFYREVSIIKHGSKANGARRDELNFYHRKINRGSHG